MTKFSVPYIAILLSVAAGASAANEGLDAAEWESMRSHVLEVHERTRNVGGQIFISRSGERVLDLAFGVADVATGRKVTAETPFLIMSVTKAFTGAALSRAVSQGLIAPDDQVARSFPDHPELANERRTVRDLIIHTAGVPHRSHPERRNLYDRHFDTAIEALAALDDRQWTDTNPYRRPNWSVGLLVGDLGAALGFHGWADPGEFGYSSGNYMVLAALLERSSGIDFKTYVDEQVLTPLGLANTGFQDVGHLPATLARNYSLQDVWTYDPSDELQEIPRFDYSYNMGGGGMYATAGDLGRFGEALLSPGSFTRAELERLWYPAAEDSSWRYGWILGEDAAGRPRMAISGATIGVMASLRVYPVDGVVAAAIVNCWCRDPREAELIFAVPDRLVDRYLAANVGPGDEPK